jgi:hypothetical protein
LLVVFPVKGLFHKQVTLVSHKNTTKMHVG